jgi:hypothetical protein
LTLSASVLFQKDATTLTPELYDMVCEFVTRGRRPEPSRVDEFLLRAFTSHELRLDLSGCRWLDSTTFRKLATSPSLLASRRVHLDLSKVAQLQDEVLDEILRSLGPRLVSLDVSGMEY